MFIYFLPYFYKSYVLVFSKLKIGVNFIFFFLGYLLGIIRSLHSMNRLTHVYCTETRPYNQGSRLTAYELVHEKIPATLICDSMAAALFKTQKISAVVVGADRVVANGEGTMP